jgi:thioredoxin reductase (NADPH)
MTPETRDLIIIGGGPAAYTAALYAARANLKPLVIEGFLHGGQLMITSDVENYPGFIDGILGPEIMDRFRKQAERFGTEFVSDNVTRVEFSERPFRVWVGDDEYRAHAVIAATGANARQLGLESEVALHGRGVSYCAVCDAAFYPDKRVFVVGGGDSALEEASFLAKFVREVVVVHRRKDFRASQIMQDYARAKENLRVLTPYVVEHVDGIDSGCVTGLRLRNVETGEARYEQSDGLFVAIGHEPATELFLDQLDHDEAGYLVTKDGSTATNVEGVFAAGDVVDHTYRQAVTAAGSGCMAALDAERWLAHGRGLEAEAEAISPEAHWRHVDAPVAPAQHV